MFGKAWTVFIDIAQSILVALCLLLVVYVFLVRPFQVSGLSMYPTFHDGEFVLTNIIGLQFADPKKGDVIVFHSPVDADKDYIKRVIGIAGDTVMLKGGDVYLNGNRLDESAYLASDVHTYAGKFLSEETPITVPAGQFFVLGDNRPNSSDSRFFGPITRSAIIGESSFVYWPPDRARVITNPYKK